MITKIIEDTVIFSFKEENYKEVIPILEGIDFSDEKNVTAITNIVTKLPINEQIHVYSYIFVEMYKVSGEDKRNSNVLKFLSQPIFKTHRNFIYALIKENTEAIDKLSKELGVNFVIQ